MEVDRDVTTNRAGSLGGDVYPRNTTQAHFSMLAYANIDIKAMTGTDGVFSSIHSFLSHCSMVSKMLKATDDADRSKSISGVLGIQKSSLIHKTAFRNDLEHYDKGLKNWIHDLGPNVSIGTYNVGSKNAIQVPGLVYVSHYDPGTNVFTFVNRDFDLSFSSRGSKD